MQRAEGVKRSPIAETLDCKPFQTEIAVADDNKRDFYKSRLFLLPQNTVPAAGPSTFAQKNFSTIDFCKNPIIERWGDRLGFRCAFKSLSM